MGVDAGHVAAHLIDAINEVLPGLVGDGANEISLDSIQDSAGAVGLIGLLGVLYAGLGWLSSLQTALIVLFEMPERLQPNFIIGKLRDLATLATLGLVLMLSVAASGVLTRMSKQVLDWLHFGSGLGWLVALLAVCIGIVEARKTIYPSVHVTAVERRKSEGRCTDCME